MSYLTNLNIVQNLHKNPSTIVLTESYGRLRKNFAFLPVFARNPPRERRSLPAQVGHVWRRRVHYKPIGRVILDFIHLLLCKYSPFLLLTTLISCQTLVPWGMQWNTSLDDSLVLDPLSSDGAYYIIFRF